MSKNLKLILNALGMALLVFILVNSIYFLIDFNKIDNVETWGIDWKHGTFSIDGNLSGMTLGSAKANGFIFLVFVVALIFGYRKSKSKN